MYDIFLHFFKARLSFATGISTRIMSIDIDNGHKKNKRTKKKLEQCS